MSPRPCTACKARIPGKPITVYSAWFNERRERISYRHRLCEGCAIEWAENVWSHRITEDPDSGTCPGCGTWNVDDQLLVYYVVYPPKAEPRYYDVPFCTADGQVLVAQLAGFGERMPNRDGFGAGAPAPSERDWATVLP